MKTIHTKDGKTIEIEMIENLYERNDAIAADNIRLMDEHGIHAIDILGSIGSGKTSLVQQLVQALAGMKRIAAIAGDITTTIDADRIREKGGDVLQVNTDGGCHLDSNMIQKSLNMLDLSNLDLIFIENVGNLICPGEVAVGAHQRMVVVSTTEGPYMIVKHPHIFQEATVVAINKIDLADAMEVDLDRLKADAQKIKPGIKVVFTNARTGVGIAKLIDALGIGA